MTHSTGADTVDVTITDGTQLIGTVKSAVVDKLTAALTGFDTKKNYGTVTLEDANDSSTEKLTAGTAESSAVTTFVANLKTNEGTQLKNLVTENISGLNGNSVSIKVTGTENTEAAATYDFSFTVEATAGG